MTGGWRARVETSLFTSLLNVGAALLVVLALAVVLLRFAAPWLQRLQTPGGCEIEVVELRSLDRQHRVALLRVRQEDFLVALGSGSPRLLRAWPSEASVSASTGSSETAAPAAGSPLSSD